MFGIFQADVQAEQLFQGILFLHEEDFAVQSPVATPILE
jgi:hypothetical protein